MKHKRALAIALSFCLFGTALPYNSNRTEAAAVKLKKIKLDQSFRVIKKGGKVKLKATFTPKKAKTKVTWKSSNKKIATVSKSGVVKGKKKGKVTITAKAKGKKATCKIQVGVPVKKITVSKKTLSLKVGQSVNAGAAVQPKNASVKKITYSTSNKKVATVNKSGKISAVAVGKATINLVSGDGNGIKQAIVVNVTATGGSGSKATSSPSQPGNNGSTTPTPTPSGDDKEETSSTPTAPPDEGEPSGNPSGPETDSPTPTPTLKPTPKPNPEKVVDITDEDEFEWAFDDDLKELHFTTEEEVELTIPEGDYPYTDVYIDAPNADILVEGNIHKLYLENKNSVDDYYPTVRTCKKLSVENSAKFRLIVMSGGELSDVTSKTTTVCPDIYGLGMIRQKISEPGQETLVPALATNEELRQTNVDVSGQVLSAVSGDAVKGATVLIMPYSGDYQAGDILTEAQIKAIGNDKNNDAVLTETDKDGIFEEPFMLQGNYFVAVCASGFQAVTGFFSITSQYGGYYVADTLKLLPDGNASSKGTVQGTVIWDTTKGPAAGVSVSLRRGLNNIAGAEIDSVTADASGGYKFDNVSYGTYTLVISSGNETDGCVMSWENVVVADTKQTVNLYADKSMKEGQWRFVASWLGAIQDANLHMTGPGVSGTDYHVWSGDTAIYEDGSLSMEANSKTESVSQMEAVTLYQQGEGEYAVTVCAINAKNSETALSQSGMQVKAYQGGVLAAVYHVPLQEGNVWNVITYDSTDGSFVNPGELSEEESEEDYFFGYDKSFRGELVDMLSDCEQYRTLLAGGYDYVEGKITHLQDIIKSLKDEEKYSDAYDAEIIWFEDMQGEFFVDITGANVDEMIYQWNDNDIIVYTDKQGVLLYDLDVDFGDAVVKADENLCAKGARMAYQVTMGSGRSRIFQLYVKTVLEAIKPIGAKIGYDDTPFYYDESVQSDYGIIYLYDDFNTNYVNQAEIDFGETGADIRKETDESGNEFIVVTVGDEQKKWLLTRAYMPKFTTNDSNCIYTHYKGDDEMTVYWKSSLPETWAYSNYVLAGYNIGWNALTEPKPTEEQIEEGVYTTTITCKKSGEADRTITVTHIVPKEYVTIDTISVWDEDAKEWKNGEIEQVEGKNAITITFPLTKAPTDWTKVTMKVSFVDDEDEELQWVNRWMTKNYEVKNTGTNNEGTLKPNFYGYSPNTYTLKVG
ncbi:MAG: Ig-like domain-containing protein [Lachnospiraceae bacterium]|nr:Ig-like domain-containing protein [Lachnospiraceae bacterium]